MVDKNNMLFFAAEFNDATGVKKNATLTNKVINDQVIKDILEKVKDLHKEFNKPSNTSIAPDVTIALCGILYETLRGVDICGLSGEIANYYLEYHKEKMKKGL